MLDCQIRDPINNFEHNNESKQKKRIKMTKSDGEGEKCVGLGRRMELKRIEKQQSGAPASWLARNFMIFVVLGILFYTYYVFVVRVCIPMIQLQFKALGTKSQGIIYITIFHILFVMFIWNYSVVVMTGPGYAKDYVHKSEPPMEDAELVEYFGQNLAEPQTFQDNNAQPESFSLESSHVQSQQQQQQDDLEDAVNETTGVLGPVVASVVDQITFPPQQARIQSANLNQTTIPLSPSQSQPSHSTLVANDVSEPTGFKPKIERSPIQKSVLTENYRYDYREGFLRPYRSHRCRHSGAVVLRLDHFCPYVGGSIGAKNHKYFINFVTWSTIFTGFVLISLLIISITHSSRIDGQIIAIIALSGFFTIFTFPLLVAHIRFALLNLTTIEDISNTRMRSRERAALNQLYGWNNFRVKKLTKQYWNQEWGRIGKEGNLWWLGSRKANWTMLMGENKLAWFLPIKPIPEHDGLNYIPNPRFSKEGHWRRRSEWPEELR